MVQGASEIAAVCVGLLGLVGAAAATGLPTWKVTAFIGENIIVMEARWEGLWMSCYRQANIRMQCKAYDSLLVLPPELQAARGLMCCSVALSALGLVVALAGMRCVACLESNRRAKTLMLMVAGVVQLMSCLCVVIPVSWTGNAVIRDFYNPLLINAQKRELGDALYIGWVTGAFLFASAMLFLCRHLPSESGLFDVYQGRSFLHYKPAPETRQATSHRPIPNVSSLPSTAKSQVCEARPSTPLQHLPHTSLVHPPAYNNPTLRDERSSLHRGSVDRRSPVRTFSHVGNLQTPPASVYMSRLPLTASYQSSFHPVPHAPVFIQYTSSQIQACSDGGSSGGVYI